MLFADVGIIENLLREISLFLCQIVYKFMVYLYELFEVVGTADVITSDSINVVYTRIGLILGIYMMFRVILAFIQMLINPDNISDKEKGVGNLAKKAIIVVALMGITPYIFEKAFDIQNFIVGVDSKSNVIAKIVFPEKVVSSKGFGSSLAAYLFTSFYRYDAQYTGHDCPLLYQQGDTTVLYNAIVANGGSVGVARLCLFDNEGENEEFDTSTFTVEGDDSLEYYKIDFTWNGIFAFLVGGFTCYVLLTYTLYVGARVIQLAFFRIIAPMAILSYLSPKKDTMFEKWIKMCGTTYVDLFIRMAIIYFVVFAIDLIMGSGNGIALTREYDHEWIVNIVMIVALLLFAKKAPELLKELFPSSGVGSLGFGFKSPKNLFNDMLGGNLLSKGYDKMAGFAKSVPKRAYGAAAVGLGASGLAFRRGIGKTLDLRASNRAERDKIKSDFESGKISASEADKQLNALDKKMKKQLWRTTGGAVGTGLKGMARGITTTNKNQRQAATVNTADATKSRYKVRDAGYSFGDQMKDRGRAFLGRDQGVEDLTAANDAAIQGVNHRIMGIMQEKGNLMKGYSVQESRSEPGKFLIVGSKGAENNGEYFTREAAEEFLKNKDVEDVGINSIFEVSDLNKQIGALSSQNKALNQKQNEQKPKSDK